MQKSRQQEQPRPQANGGLMLHAMSIASSDPRCRTQDMNLLLKAHLHVCRDHCSRWHPPRSDFSFQQPGCRCQRVACRRVRGVRSAVAKGHALCPGVRYAQQVRLHSDEETVNRGY